MCALALAAFARDQCSTWVLIKDVGKLTHLYLEVKVYCVVTEVIQRFGAGSEVGNPQG